MKKEANKQNTTINATIINSAWLASWPFPRFRRSLSLFGTEPHKKISRGAVARHPGEFEDSRCVDTMPRTFFFSSGGLQILLLSNPCRIHRNSIPLPRLLKQHPGSLPNHSPRRSPPSRKLLTPVRKSFPPRLSLSIHLAISAYIITLEQQLPHPSHGGRYSLSHLLQ